jgi:L-asparaginase/Glu-tRNA(Gln) amidotransferase subunit D
MQDVEEIIRELRVALKKDDDELRREVQRIVRKYSYRKRKKGAFEMKAGRAYYINEKVPEHAIRILKQILDRGLMVLYITRMNPEGLEIGDYDNARVLWLTNVKGKDRISPGDLTKIHASIVEFMNDNEKGIVLLDGIETMVTNTDFLKVLHLLQKIRDVISEKHGILVVSLDLNTLNAQEQALFKKEIMYEIPVKK